MMAEKKLHAAVIFGGRSGEHRASLRSARSVAAALDAAGDEVTQISMYPSKAGRDRTSRTYRSQE